MIYLSSVYVVGACEGNGIAHKCLIIVIRSLKRSNCYMVWGGDVTNAAHSSSRSNVDLEIGCLIDLATGLLTFTVNGKELSTSYQVL